MPEFTIRRALEADFEILPGLEDRSDRVFDALPEFASLAGYPNLSAKGYLDLPESTRIWMAEIDQPAGFAYSFDMDDCAYIAQLSIVPEMQGRGVGSALIQAMSNAARQASKLGLVLTTFKTVPWNAPFYARRGFEILKRSQMGPELAAHATKDDAKWSPYSPRVAMGRFF